MFSKGSVVSINTALKLDSRDAYAYYNRGLAFLVSTYIRNHIHSRNNKLQLTFKHLDIILQDLDRTLQINPHDKDAIGLFFYRILLSEIGYEQAYLHSW